MARNLYGVIDQAVHNVFETSTDRGLIFLRQAMGLKSGARPSFVQIELDES